MMSTSVRLYHDAVITWLRSSSSFCHIFARDNSGTCCGNVVLLLFQNSNRKFCSIFCNSFWLFSQYTNAEFRILVQLVLCNYPSRCCPLFRSMSATSAIELSRIVPHDFLMIIIISWMKTRHRTRNHRCTHQRKNSLGEYIDDYPSYVVFWFMSEDTLIMLYLLFRILVDV